MMEDLEDLFDTSGDLPDGADDRDVDFSSDNDKDLSSDDDEPHHHSHLTVIDTSPSDGGDFTPRNEKERRRAQRIYVVLIVSAIVFFVFLLYMIKV